MHRVLFAGSTVLFVALVLFLVLGGDGEDERGAPDPAAANDNAQVPALGYGAEEVSREAPAAPEPQPPPPPLPEPPAPKDDAHVRVAGHVRDRQERSVVGARLRVLDIGGRVLLPSGEPASGCNVMVFPWTTSPYDRDHDRTRQNVTADAEGRFRISLQSGAYRVSVHGPQYRRKAEARADVREGDTTEVEVRLP